MCTMVMFTAYTHPRYIRLYLGQVNEIMAQIQLPAVAPFNLHGYPTSILQRFATWKKSVEYFLGASGTTSDVRKKGRVLHLFGPAIQEIFETLQLTDASCVLAIIALVQHFSVQKNSPVEGGVVYQCKQRQWSHFNNISHT